MTNLEFEARKLVNDPTTVFIIGAGAHCDIGMPTGEELRNLIISNAYTPKFAYGTFGHMDPLHTEVARSESREFLREFSQSGQYSIDRFLECDAGIRYRELGAMHIAHAILKAQAEAFYHGAALQSWYRWMFSNLFDSPNKLSNIKCSFVTFNYDTCFESLIAMMHSSSHGVPLAESIHSIESMRIYHVYGSLKVFPILDSASRRYVMPDVSKYVQSSSKNIKLLGDREPATRHLDEIRSVVRSAKNILFLGFSFDPRNLQRIGFDEHSEFWGMRPVPQCFGTCMGIPGGRLRRIEECMSMPVRWARPERDCRGLLENLFIY